MNAGQLSKLHTAAQDLWDAAREVYLKAEDVFAQVSIAEIDAHDAERAVSPAESVQSINDCAAYNSAMGELVRVAAVGGTMTLMKKQQALSEIIDAQIANAREEGFETGKRHAHEQACKITHALMAERDEQRQRAESAEAEQLRMIDKIGELHERVAAARQAPEGEN